MTGGQGATTHGEEETGETALPSEDGKEQGEECQAGKTGRDGGDDQGPGQDLGVTWDQGVVVL